MAGLVTAAAWVLVVTFAISLAYELHRWLTRRGSSRYDTTGWFVQTLVLDALAATVVVLLLAGVAAGPWVGLVFTVAAIAASVLFYAPTVMPVRFGGTPALVDWVECLAYTGGLFAAAALLGYAVLGPV